MSADALVKKVSACVDCLAAHSDFNGYFCALDGNKVRGVTLWDRKKGGPMPAPKWCPLRRSSIVLEFNEAEGTADER